MQYAKSFIQYTAELSGTRFDPLTIEDERKTIIAYKNGSKEAFDKIVCSNLRFVLFSLKYYSIPKDVDIMDLVQEGNLGLMEAVSRYDPLRYKCRVFTYCFWWIRFFIGKALKEKNKYSKIFIQYPSQDEEYKYNNPFFLSDVVEDNYYEDIARDMFDYISEFIKDEKQKKIVILFFGLEYPYVSKTLEEIGSLLHISLERVRQLKKDALKKLTKEKENFCKVL
mgnify:CR=1 FL=1